MRCHATAYDQDRTGLDPFPFMAAIKCHETHTPATPAVASTQQLSLPLERISVRIPAAIQKTGIGRSKLYELIASGDIETAKVGASTLIIVASLKRLIEARRR